MSDDCLTGNLYLRFVVIPLGVIIVKKSISVSKPKNTTSVLVYHFDLFPGLNKLILEVFGFSL